MFCFETVSRKNLKMKAAFELHATERQQWESVSFDTLCAVLTKRVVVLARSRLGLVVEAGFKANGLVGRLADIGDGIVQPRG